MFLQASPVRHPEAGEGATFDLSTRLQVHDLQQGRQVVQVSSTRRQHWHHQGLEVIPIHITWKISAQTIVWKFT